VGKYIHGKQKKEITIEQLSDLLLKVKKEPRTEHHYLGVDPLRDSSLLIIYFFSGLRLSEVVGDRPRRFKVSRFSMAKREDMVRSGINWKTQPNAYVVKTSPEYPGIRKEDIEFDEEKNVLKINALALKHGKRDSPLQLSLDLPYVDLVKQQWERTSPGKKVWNLKREYAWQIIKELDPKFYTHYFRFNRVMEFIRDPKTNPAHLLSWFGWRRLQTAYNYLALGGRRIEEMSATMIEQYTGKKVEVSSEQEKEETSPPQIEPKKEEVEVFPSTPVLLDNSQAQQSLEPTKQEEKKGIDIFQLLKKDEVEPEKREELKMGALAKWKMLDEAIVKEKIFWSEYKEGMEDVKRMLQKCGEEKWLVILKNTVEFKKKKYG